MKKACHVDGFRAFRLRQKLRRTGAGGAREWRAPQHDENGVRLNASNLSPSSPGRAIQRDPGDPFDVETKDGSPGRGCFAAPEDDDVIVERRHNEHRASYEERPGEPCKHKPNMPDGSYHPYPYRDEIRAEHSKQTSSSPGATLFARHPGDPSDFEKKDGLPGRANRAPEDDGRSIGSAATGEKSGAITGKITGPITGHEDAPRAHQAIDATFKSELRNSARIFLPEFLPDRGHLARPDANGTVHAGKMPALRQEADCSNFISPPPLSRKDIERLNGAG